MANLNITFANFMITSFSKVSICEQDKLKTDIFSKISQVDKSVMDPLENPEELEKILGIGDGHKYSHIVFDDQKNIQGVVLAHRSQDFVANKAKDIHVVVVVKLAIFGLEQRRKGLGSKLLHQVAFEATQENIHEIRVLVYKSNDVAMKFYFKNGFDYVDKEFDEPWDSYLLKAKLSDLQKAANSATLEIG